MTARSLSGGRTFGLSLSLFPPWNKKKKTSSAGLINYNSCFFYFSLFNGCVKMIIFFLFPSCFPSVLFEPIIYVSVIIGPLELGPQQKQRATLASKKPIFSFQGFKVDRRGRCCNTSRCLQSEPSLERERERNDKVSSVYNQRSQSSGQSIIIIQQNQGENENKNRGQRVNRETCRRRLADPSKQIE